jgi:HD superfamily phosphohydrolase/serine/threonine protein kinase
LAALLHDIGHGPLSHIWEDLFDWRHEDAGREILNDNSTRLNKLLSRPSEIDRSFAQFDGLINEILSFFDGTHHLHFLLSLISGHLDVDRLDFMARDTRAAGVTYGFHDLEWIIRSLRFARIPTHVLANGGIKTSRWVVAIDGRKGLNTLIQFLRARENMYDLVYHHKTSRAAQCLLEKILSRVDTLIKAEKPPAMPTPHLFAWLKGDHSSKIITKIEDEDVLCAIKLWADDDDAILSTLCRKSLERDLYKVVEISSNVADMLETIDRSDHGRHLLKGVENILEEQDAVGNLPTESQYWYGFDQTHFDMIGDPEKDDDNPIWIIGFGRFGLEYTPLRQFWIQRFGQRSLSVTKHYVHCFNATVAEGVRTYVERLPQFSDKHGDLNPVEVDQYRPIKLISKSGATKEVYLGINLRPGSTARSLVAMKYYKDVTNVHRDLEKPNIKLEGADRRNITLASGYKHPSDPQQYILIESCWHASLEALVKENGLRRDLEEIVDMGLQLFSGLSVLHDRNIRHTDIKLDNCGYSYDRKTRVYKIGDFGCMSERPSELPSDALIGTKRTIAPERLGTSPRIGLVSDVWALGVTIYALCAGQYWFMPITVPHQGEGRPPEAETRMAEMIAAVTADVPGAVEKFRNRAEKEVPPILWGVLKHCFADFEQRAAASAVAETFKESHQTLIRKAADERGKIRSLWHQFEDLKALPDAGKLRELRESSRELKDYVPQSLWGA